MNSLLKLLRFLAWYGVAVVTLFYLLPLAGLMIEAHFHTLSSSARFFSVIGVFVVIAIWQVLDLRDRWRGAAQVL
jgi:positive regulator of sigma E activity